MVGRVFEYFLSKKKRDVIILVGTSGDTGAAAIYAVKDLKHVDIVVLYPKGKSSEETYFCKGRISKIQELQMVTHQNPTVHVYAVEGTSDDLDVPIRSVQKQICLLMNALGIT